MRSDNKQPGFRRDGAHSALWLPNGYSEPEDDDEQPSAHDAAPPMPPPGPPARPQSLEQRLYEQREVRIRDVDPRPSDAGEVVGQDEALEQARINLGSASPSHMIFTGPPGVGKTTIARLAMKLAMESPTCRFAADASFVEVDCTTLYRGDNGMNNLVSTVVEGYYSESVRGYCAMHGLPPSSTMINLGSTAKAHGGVLLLDEIGEMSAALHNSLLKVLEDGREIITTARYNSAETYPAWYRSFFSEGIPAQFVLIACTTRSPSELPPALRSRCTIVPFRALTVEDRSRIAVQTASKYDYAITEGAANLIAAQSDGGRDSARKVQVAISRASARGSSEIDVDDVPPGVVSLPPRAVCVRDGHIVTLTCVSRCARCSSRLVATRAPGQCSCGRPATHSVIIADDEHGTDIVCGRCRAMIGYACVATPMRLFEQWDGGDASAGTRL